MALIVNVLMAVSSLGLMAFGYTDWSHLMATLLVAFDVYLLADVIY